MGKLIKKYIYTVDVFVCNTLIGAVTYDKDKIYFKIKSGKALAVFREQK